MIPILFTTIIVASLFAVYKLRYKAVFLLPAYIVIFDVLYGFYQTGSGFGALRNISLFIFLTVLVFRKKTTLYTNIFINVFLLYTMALLFFSSDFKVSAMNYLVVYNSFVCFLIGFNYLRNLDNLKILNTGLIILAIVFIINSIISAVFNLGRDYYGSGFTSGGFVIMKLYSPALFVALLPIILPLAKKEYRKFIIILASLVYIFLIISMRRTAIFIPVLCYFIFFLLSKDKIKIISAVTGFAFILLLAYPFYQKVLHNQLAARDYFEGRTLEDEYRFKETIIIYEETFSNLKTALTGEEVFNSIGNYNNGNWGLRPIHVDYNKLIHGTGLIGLVLYIMIFLNMFLKFIKYRNALPDEPYFDNIKSVFIMLLVIILVIGFSGGILAISYRAVLLIYMGSILGIMDKYYNHRQVLQEL